MNNRIESQERLEEHVSIPEFVSFGKSHYRNLSRQ